MSHFKLCFLSFKFQVENLRHFFFLSAVAACWIGSGTVTGGFVSLESLEGDLGSLLMAGSSTMQNDKTLVVSYHHKLQINIDIGCSC